ncbi:MAG TPA: SMP-30/gluconolactonase/LRE family protein, partial [Mycobacterium sp.]|nr:SMP-30/gluconolactonase/LRE family protein [Mycobacterium sp.]
MANLQTLLGGRAFLEGPRWHDGALYVSDMHAHEVLRVATDGAVDVLARLDAAPSGLGWLPDGSMLIVSMDDRRILRRGDDGSLTQHADLSELASHAINDMVVDGAGHAFVSQFGCDLFGGEVPKPAPLLRVDPDGSAHEVTDGLRFANGMVVTADGRTLVVAESAGRCLTAFSLAPDGALSDRRPWADLPETDYPDGIGIDAEDAIWVSGPASDRFVRVRAGG